MRTAAGALAISLLLGVGSVWGAEVSEDEIRAAGLQPLRAGIKIVDFELADLRGVKRKLSGYAGSVVLLNFWATWCGPCRAEMPSMQRLQDSLGAKGLRIVAVDLAEGADLAAPFVRELRLTFDVLLDLSGAVGGEYGVRALPTTYLIDRSGTVLAGKAGAQEWDTPEVKRFLERVLALPVR